MKIPFPRAFKITLKNTRRLGINTIHITLTFLVQRHVFSGCSHPLCTAPAKRKATAKPHGSTGLRERRYERPVDSPRRGLD